MYLHVFQLVVWIIQPNIIYKDMDNIQKNVTLSQIDYIVERICSTSPNVSSK